MTDIVNKITSYNLFNYLLPGVLFAAFADYITSYKFIQNDIVVGAFVYYFIGLVISRFGSLVIEPILKKTSFLKFTEYKKFVSASIKDPKIEILSETNNMYRTFNAMLILLILLKLYEFIVFKLSILKGYSPFILIILLLIIFLYSYRKQTSYITNRIEANN